MKQSVKNFVLWGLTFFVFFGIILLIINSFNDENEKLSWIEIITNGCLFVISMYFFVQLKEGSKRVLAKKTTLSQRWQHQFGEGFSGISIAFLILLFDKPSIILNQITSPTFIYKASIFYLFFVFIIGYLSWKGYNTWGSIFGKGKKKTENQ